MNIDAAYKLLTKADWYIAVKDYAKALNYYLQAEKMCPDNIEIKFWKAVSLVNIPLVAASGAGTLEDILTVVKEANPSGVALASLLHFNVSTIKEVKEYLRGNGVEVSL